jgi:lipoprotein-anchoring transpeptidase ErfK/SrfK
MLTARARALAAATAVVLAAGLGAAAIDLASSGADSPVALDSRPFVGLPPPTVPVTTTSTMPPPQVPVSTTLATPQGSVPTFASPGGAPTGSVGIWYGYALTLPVVATQPGWLQVRLPQRPNQSVAWIQSGGVALSTTPYRLVVSVGAEQLTVYKSGYPIMQAPIGVGTPATPTVTGSYFITAKAPPPNSGYGPFVLSTSAHSDAIQSWEGAGDAIIALHGPITSYADSLIGTGRARVSNGCIRMHDADLAKLAGIAPGTPLDIVA